MRRTRTKREAFDSHVARSEEGCWEWRAFRTADGYGRFSYLGKQVIAHRFAYEEFVGPIPVGYAVDHLCCNRGCVNPAHLEAVTWAENSRRIWTRMDTCRRGHPYDEANTYRPPKGGRICRACRQLANGRRRVRHENARPDYGRLQRECKNGHPRTPENTYVSGDGKVRRCKVCVQLATRKSGGYFDPNRERATHCPQGHEFTAENTYVSAKGYRTCKKCNRESSLRRYYAKKQAV